MHNEHDDNDDKTGDEIRREILGELNADLIDEAARRKFKEIDPEIIDEFHDFVQSADDSQMFLLNLSQMWMEIGLSMDDKRMAYASCAALALSGALDKSIDEGDWGTVMDYAEAAWESAQRLMSSVIDEQVERLIEG